MSIGNLKDSGNQGNNFPWQLKMLLGQQCACDQLTQINANTDNVEFLLSAILTTLQAETEYEAKFVVDTCNGDVVYLEVRVWNPDTSTWGPITYYLPGSDTPVIPPGASTPGCLIYTDPSAVLALILGAIQAGNLILQNIDNSTNNIESNTLSLVNTFNAVTRTPGLIRATSAGTIAAGARSISVYNAGNAAGSILGVAGNILPGEILNYDAGGENDVLTAFAYDGTGTTLVITTIV